MIRSRSEKYDRELHMYVKCDTSGIDNYARNELRALTHEQGLQRKGLHTYFMCMCVNMVPKLAIIAAC